MKVFVFIVFLFLKSSAFAQPQEVFFEPDTVLTTYSVEEEGVFLGRVPSVSMDAQRNIYLVDRDSKKVWKFNEEGHFLSSYLEGEGKGPGEVLRPTQCFVDEEGSMYVLDGGQNKIIILDSEGNFVREQVLKMRPSRVAAFSQSKFFVVGYRFSYKDENIVHVYELDEEGEYQLAESIGKRIPFGNETALNLTGYSDFIDVKDQTLYVNWHLPYHFEVFNDQLHLEASITLEKKEFTPPKREGMVVKVATVGREILPLKDYNFVRYRVLSESDDQASIDYFDKYTKDWKFIETLSAANLGIAENGKHFVSVPHQNALLVSYEEEQFVLLKYRLD